MKCNLVLRAVGVAAIAVFSLVDARAAEPELPAVRVESVRRAFHNGEHNAFTDLIRYRDSLYLTFRSCPDGHGVFPTSSIIVLTSEDGSDWREVTRFSVPMRDVRDPHFLIFKEKLFVYSGAWYTGETAPERRDMNQHLGYAVWTENGSDWSEPTTLEGTYGHYVWRAAAQGGKAYLCARRKKDFAEARTREERNPVVQAALLESDDGLVWRTAGLFTEEYGNETAFFFEQGGDILALARGGGNRNAQVLRSRAPFRAWERTELDRQVGGPLLVRWGEFLLAGGRKSIGDGPKTSLYWLADGRLQEFAELPSGGDNSYPGFVETGPGRALVSYYSSHERDGDGKPITAIYLAELALEQ